jgi:nucleotide-binding universal stress UspA family protein
MRALIWIAEDTWEAAVDAAAQVLAPDAGVTLLHVAAADVEELAAAGPRGLLGRRHPPPPGPPPPALSAISDEEARALLADARERLGRDAELLVRRGRVEREVVDASKDMDLLVVARDGDRERPGPKSLGPHVRFVVDHASCAVLLVWPER